MFALGTRLTPLRIPTSRARVHRGRGLAARPARVRAATPAQPGPASLEGQTPVGDEPFSLGLRRDAEDALELGEPLGRGAMGVVRLATRKRDGCRFALKTIPKSGPASLEGQTPSATPCPCGNERFATKSTCTSRSARPSTSSRSTTGSRTRLGCTFSSISATAATSSPAPARRIRRTIRRPTRRTSERRLPRRKTRNARASVGNRSAKPPPRP